MGPADPAPTGQQQPLLEPAKMATEKILVKVSDKLTAPWDYQVTLVWIYSQDKERSPEVYE